MYIKNSRVEWDEGSGFVYVAIHSEYSAVLSLRELTVNNIGISTVTFNTISLSISTVMFFFHLLLLVFQAVFYDKLSSCTNRAEESKYIH